MSTSPFPHLVPAGEHRREESLPNEGTVEMSLDGHEGGGWRQETDSPSRLGIWVRRANFFLIASGSRDLWDCITWLHNREEEEPKSTASLRHMDAHLQSCACAKFPSPFRILNFPHHWGACQEKYQKILISRQYETQKLHPYQFFYLFKTHSHLSWAHIFSDALSSPDNLMVLLPPPPKNCSFCLPIHHAWFA